MAYRLELSDLPPRYRAQAEAQLAGRGKKRGEKSVYGRKGK